MKIMRELKNIKLFGNVLGSLGILLICVAGGSFVKAMQAPAPTLTGDALGSEMDAAYAETLCSPRESSFGLRSLEAMKADIARREAPEYTGTLAAPQIKSFREGFAARSPGVARPAWLLSEGGSFDYIEGKQGGDPDAEITSIQARTSKYTRDIPADEKILVLIPSNFNYYRTLPLGLMAQNAQNSGHFACASAAPGHVMRVKNFRDNPTEPKPNVLNCFGVPNGGGSDGHTFVGGCKYIVSSENDLTSGRLLFNQAHHDAVKELSDRIERDFDKATVAIHDNVPVAYQLDKIELTPGHHPVRKNVIYSKVATPYPRVTQVFFSSIELSDISMSFLARFELGEQYAARIAENCQRIAYHGAIYAAIVCGCKHVFLPLIGCGILKNKVGTALSAIAELTDFIRTYGLHVTLVFYKTVEEELKSAAMYKDCPPAQITQLARACKYKLKNDDRNDGIANMVAAATPLPWLAVPRPGVEGGRLCSIESIIGAYSLEKKVATVRIRGEGGFPAVGVPLYRGLLGQICNLDVDKFTPITVPIAFAPSIDLKTITPWRLLSDLMRYEHAYSDHLFKAAYDRIIEPRWRHGNTLCDSSDPVNDAELLSLYNAHLYMSNHSLTYDHFFNVLVGAALPLLLRMAVAAQLWPNIGNFSDIISADVFTCDPEKWRAFFNQTFEKYAGWYEMSRNAFLLPQPRDFQTVFNLLREYMRITFDQALAAVAKESPIRVIDLPVQRSTDDAQYALLRYLLFMMHGGQSPAADSPQLADVFILRVSGIIESFRVLGDLLGFQITSEAITGGHKDPTQHGDVDYWDGIFSHHYPECVVALYCDRLGRDKVIDVSSTEAVRGTLGTFMSAKCADLNAFMKDVVIPFNMWCTSAPMGKHHELDVSTHEVPNKYALSAEYAAKVQRSHERGALGAQNARTVAETEEASRKKREEEAAHERIGSGSHGVPTPPPPIGPEVALFSGSGNTLEVLHRLLVVAHDRAIGLLRLLVRLH